MKEKNVKRTAILTTIVCLIPVLAGAILYSKLPDTVVTHWDASGTPNGWESKFVGVIVFPGILVLVNLLFPVLLKVDPKYKNMDGKLLGLVQWIIPIISMFCSGTTLSAALGKELPIPLMGTLLIGLMFVAIGNYLPKTKQSYTLGIRLPWTLYSEENWNKTHRLAGFLWVIGGFCVIILGLMGLGAVALPVMIIVCVLVPTVYSYWLYRKSI